MKRSYLTLNIMDENDLIYMNRWLFKDHAPDTVSQNGPILERYCTYRALPFPQGAKEYGAYNWRMTEHWWREDPWGHIDSSENHGSAICEIWPERYNDIIGQGHASGARTGTWKGEPEGDHPPVFTFVPYRPNNCFKGAGITLKEGPFYRFVVQFKYPEGVSYEEGEEWFLNHFAPEVSKQPELLRFFAFKVIEPFAGPFVRVMELWYKDPNSWKKAWVDNIPQISKPSWATYDKAPYLQPYVDWVSIFLEERAECDFLNDYNGYYTTA
ncbi:hypothetical protein GC105_02910 [Alkalibaculum sp. M08DMB]|uniref:Chalcone isomerase N-terminal domain-containing protein n=1 Tax=Alkalibaculum sporogenes TaxID=2655001 RepID=A0A6A7K5Q8_9FIRM|nr:hypothetical protein [Alkalibaculum sporogenes]MPW24740.1 hypothetical protein [Alkalibaculum sporogenes]